MTGAEQAHTSGRGRKRGAEREGKNSRRSPAEWITLGVSAALLLALVGLIVYDWVVTPQAPPVIGLAQTAPVRVADGAYYVPYTIRNDGGYTAESVQIIAQLQAGGEVETSEQHVDFLSSGETQQGAFIFSHDPRAGRLTMRVASYRLP